MILDRAWIRRRLANYRFEYFWYDVVETCRKVLVIGLVQVFFPSSKGLTQQLLIGMMLTSAMLTILAYMVPYRSRVDNVLAIICQSSLVIQFALALYLVHNRQVDSDAETCAVLLFVMWLLVAGETGSSPHPTRSSSRA